MVELKLARLPERTPVKIIFSASPELDLALRQYAGLYRAAYGQAEAVPELIPFMLEAFLESDRGFAKARKEGAMPAPPSPRRGRRPVEPEPAVAHIKEN
jgi:hypothetical protein